MFSKRLRLNQSKHQNNFICGTLYTGYYYFILNTIRNIKRFFSAVRRFWDYGKLGWASYDWDYVYLLILIRFKLKRIKAALENAYHTLDKTSIQSTRICIGLLDRLISDEYNQWKERHCSKWGKPTLDKEDYDGTLYSITDNRYKSMTSDQITQEQDEYIIAQDRDKDHKKRDIHLLFNIMSKYYTWWWD